jgi:cytosine/uracil/thiamine/allantoin permease
MKMSLSVSSALALPLSVIAQAPNPPPIAPPGLQQSADTFIGWMKWGGLVGGVVGMIICGLMMILGRRNRSATAVDGATGIPWILGGLTVIALSAGLVGALLG